MSHARQAPAAPRADFVGETLQDSPGIREAKRVLYVTGRRSECMDGDAVTTPGETTALPDLLKQGWTITAILPSQDGASYWFLAPPENPAAS